MASKDGRPPGAQVEYTRTIEEDVEILAEQGFHIDYPNGRLGTGMFATAYRGWFGANAAGYQGVNHGQPFAVKVIDFTIDPTTQQPMPARGTRSTPLMERRSRVCAETEKYIVTNINHPNLVDIKYIVNMGDLSARQFEEDTSRGYYSPQRIYIFMDLANSSLEDWLTNHRQGMLADDRIRIIRGMFHGLMYLHGKGIAHNDCHSGNALIFQQNNLWVAKWADFGRGYVSEGRQYSFRERDMMVNMTDMFEDDLYKFASAVVNEVMDGRDEGASESDEQAEILDALQAMCEDIKSRFPSDIKEIYENNKDILGPPPI